MFIPSSLSLLPIFLTSALAQSSRSLFVPTFPVVAYPLATGNGATTYLVGCTAGSDTSTCNFEQPYTLVEGQNTVQFALTASSQVVNLGCAVEGNTYMACSATGAGAAATGSSVVAYTTFTGSEVATHFRGVAIETNSNALLTWPAPTTSSSSSSTSSSSSKSSSSSSSSFNTTSSILALVVPTTAPASMNATITQTRNSTTTTGQFFASASASHTKAVASGLGNAGAPGASSNLGRVMGGAAAVVVAIAAGIW